MVLIDKFFSMHALIVIGLIAIVCIGGSGIIGLLFRLPAEPMLGLGTVFFLIILIPVALRLHTLSKFRD